MTTVTVQQPTETTTTTRERGLPRPRVRTGSYRLSDVLSLGGALVAAVATTGLLRELTPVQGGLASALVGYAAFLGIYALLVSMDETWSAVRDRLAATIVTSLGLVLLTALVFVVGFTLVKGVRAVLHLNFFTSDMAAAGPLDPLSVGGILHAVVGTLEQISIALLITVPLGLMCAVYINEFPGRLARFVRTIVEAMTALPSVVAGLFIYATFIIGLGRDKSGLAASLALSVMMLPIIIRAADVVLRLVPAPLREASYALGTSRLRTVWHVVLPTARSGLTTAVILGTARGIGETSPVLLTAGFNTVMNANPTKGPQVSLPLATFEFVRSPQPQMIERGFGTAATLLALVMALFVAARLLGGRGPGQLSRRQRRRMAAGSRRDAARFAARVGAVVVAVGLALGLALHPTTPAQAAEKYVPISGAGSTWSQNALDQWRKNVNQYGMLVNYQGTGSSDGRNQFRNGTVDFAVSEIPYGLKDAGVYDVPPTRGFAYMPIVAGGTAFMYNLTIAGKRVTNLRLSGENLAKIFTGVIKTWNDPAIAKDNPALALPAQRIVPVVRSDGSGTTAQLTKWMGTKYASLWDAYCRKAGRSTPCGVTSNYPVISGSGFTAQSGSLGVSGYVAQKQNVGTITYVEYSYALNTNFPVVKVLNNSGYYVEPTAENVAVGLMKATINSDLTQNLGGVHDNGDKRAYPLSSYSYMVIPTKAQGSFTTDKGNTLGAFANYFLCEGQQQAKSLGYSPLPINLVKAGLAQVKRIPGADVSNVDIRKCNNPTFSSSGVNTMAKNAPYPPSCDKAGATQCTTGTGGNKAPTAPSSGGGTTAAPGTTPSSAAGGATPGATGAAGGTGAGGTATGGAGAAGTGAGGAAASGGTVDPDTGQVVGATDGSMVSSGGQVVAATPVSLTADGSSGTDTALMLLAGLVLVLTVVVPPTLSRLIRNRVER
jgi:phosphate ABC transporter permease subunit PstA/phosphate ABC transporter phosphate-binding protein